MNIRKLVKSGLSSYTVALPKDWIDKNHLKKGDMIYITETPDNELSIKLDPNNKEQIRTEVVINIDGKSGHSIYREIVSVYLTEFQRFIIKGTNIHKQIKEIKKIVSSLPALEVVEESLTKVVARSFLDVHNISIKDLIRRIDNIVRAMLLDLQSLIKREITHDVIIERDEEVNRLSFLVFKILKSAFHHPDVMKSLDLTDLEAVSHWQLVFHLEKMGDETKRIARNIGENPKSINKKQLQSLIDTMYKGYTNCLTLFYKKDLNGSDNFSANRKKIFIECDKYFITNRNIVNSEISGKFKGMTSHLIDITKLVRFLP
ncbi:phosphate uptake regulator PhoU [Candidatus Woesearchaeota archaeon]|jgi:phosphate uptake regulator|nr:phosphate uptake regulator PhoU [Candidatus Woesearchaeota archaeon]